MKNNQLEIFKLESGNYLTTLNYKYLNRKSYQPKSQIVTAAIPGTIISVMVKEGQALKRGDAICVFDSMKMNNIICADWDGVVNTIYIKEGESVAKEAPLVKLNRQ